MKKGTKKADVPTSKPLLPVWEEGTVWLRTTDKDGGVSYGEHRCWNMSQFVALCVTRAMEQGGKCEQITEADYRAAIGWGRKKAA